MKLKVLLTPVYIYWCNVRLTQNLAWPEAQRMSIMKSFFQKQADLCRRIARTTPQEKIAEELLSIAADFAARAEAEEAERKSAAMPRRAWTIAPLTPAAGPSPREAERAAELVAEAAELRHGSGGG